MSNPPDSGVHIVLPLQQYLILKNYSLIDKMFGTRVMYSTQKLFGIPVKYLTKKLLGTQVKYLTQILFGIQ